MIPGRWVVSNTVFQDLVTAMAVIGSKGAEAGRALAKIFVQQRLAEEPRRKKTHHAHLLEQHIRKYKR